jgi:ketosteroid isomerase-like protein
LARYSDEMTRENLETVRAMYQRRERGDMDVDELVGTLLTLRDGLIVRWEYYWERADALEAADVKE